MPLWVYINGRHVLKEEAKVSIFDHGFLYGDGVFEGIRAYGGRVFKLSEHLQRLYNSAKAIALEIPLKEEELKEKILETLRKNNLTDAYIRLIVSRGEGDLGLDPHKCPRASVIIITDKIKIYPEELYKKGLAVITASTRRNIPSALDPQIKSLNYLNNILAKIEATEAGFLEAVMLNHEGFVAECTGDNIFIVRAGALQTPPTSAGILEGITRNVVIELARRRGIAVEEKQLTRFDLYIADECFLTGTAAEVVPITCIDGRKIGTGSPGAVTKQIMEDFIAAIRGEIEVSV